ncbi:hypothetical protein HMPREF1979_00781 [Actinomyces johnsonii F0542]|uniref:Uncharacterized protein n=1 Tax=Actinomyces johnsonii F0542 TaxID=1321818 RepID=U1QT25_9ACTO|nr:hypothetical protein HMPREF1979_00781 [Actinomyces johnsonii F0542]
MLLRGSCPQCRDRADERPRDGLPMRRIGSSAWIVDGPWEPCLSAHGGGLCTPGDLFR